MGGGEHKNCGFVFFLNCCCCCCSFSVVAMETRQYGVGDVITMRLMRREKGSLVAVPSSQWEKVEEPVRFGGERERRLFSPFKAFRGTN